MASRTTPKPCVPRDPSFDRGLQAAMPNLRAFAMSLCGNVHTADDLVAETMLRALANAGQFQIGTNMDAWLFTILRNHFRSQYRKRRHEVEDIDDRYAETLKSHSDQEGQVEFAEFREALARLPVEQREILILVGASGFSYKEAARIVDCAVGTVKSRLSRARTRVAELMGINEPAEFGPDDKARAVLASET